MGKQFLILYETKEGHTRTVAEKMAEALRADGHQATALQSQDATAEQLKAAEGILLGSSIHMGKPHKKVVRFAAAHHQLLADKRAAFFLVCLTATSDAPDKVAELQGYFETFFVKTGWRPERFRAFPGALLYTKYGFITRKILKGISEKEGGDTDTSRDFIYTDFEAVAAFARAYADDLD